MNNNQQKEQLATILYAHVIKSTQLKQLNRLKNNIFRDKAYRQDHCIIQRCWIHHQSNYFEAATLQKIAILSIRLF